MGIFTNNIYMVIFTNDIYMGIFTMNGYIGIFVQSHLVGVDLLHTRILQADALLVHGMTKKENV